MIHHMGKTFLGREDDASNKAILVVVLPFAFALITGVLYVLGLWPLAIISALVGVGVLVWAYRARENEKADEAIAAAERWEYEQGSGKSRDGDQHS